LIFTVLFKLKFPVKLILIINSTNLNEMQNITLEQLESQSTLFTQFPSYMRANTKNKNYLSARSNKTVQKDEKSDSSKCDISTEAEEIQEDNKTESSLNFHRNHIDLVASSRLNLEGKHNHAKNRAKFILRRVGDALLNMYRQERVKILEATLKKRLHDITFEEVESMDEEQRDVWRDCAFDEIRQFLDEGFADNRAIQEEIQALIKEIQEVFEKKEKMELAVDRKIQAIRQNYHSELQESLNRRKAKSGPIVKKWLGRRTKLSNLKIYEEVEDLFEEVQIADE